MVARRFVLQKKDALNKFRASVSVGDVDGGILPLLEKINSLSECYTTSSCGGRIAVFQDVGLKPEGAFLGKWHRRVKAREVLDCLRPSSGVVWFRYEPPILHVACESITAAEKMFKAAFSSGFKRTGLKSFKEGRYLLEVLSTERVDAPIMAHGKKLVSDEYIKFLVKLANKKIGESEKKIRRFEKKI